VSTAAQRKARYRAPGCATDADHPSKAKRVHALAAGPRPWTLRVRTAEALGTRPRLVRDPAMESERPA
jgi:hypothetical protein